MKALIRSTKISTGRGILLTFDQRLWIASLLVAERTPNLIHFTHWSYTQSLSLYLEFLIDQLWKIYSFGYLIHSPSPPYNRQTNNKKLFFQFRTLFQCYLIQALARRYSARCRAIRLAQVCIFKYIDPTTHLPYWVHLKTGITSWKKPKVFRADDVEHAMMVATSKTEHLVRQGTTLPPIVKACRMNGQVSTANNR